MSFVTKLLAFNSALSVFGDESFQPCFMLTPLVNQCGAVILFWNILVLWNSTINLLLWFQGCCCWSCFSFLRTYFLWGSGPLATSFETHLAMSCQAFIRLFSGDLPFETCIAERFRQHDSSNSHASTSIMLFNVDDSTVTDSKTKLSWPCFPEGLFTNCWDFLAGASSDSCDDISWL